MKSEPYQGWHNAQTWCVACTFNNTKILQDKALAIVRDNLEFLSIAKLTLRDLAGKHIAEIYDFADWAWSDGQSLTGDVNWDEIHDHYLMKVNEERREA